MLDILVGAIGKSLLHCHFNCKSYCVITHNIFITFFPLICSVVQQFQLFDAPKVEGDG